MAPLLFDYADALLDDKGGRDSAAAAEGRVIEVAQTARGASMLILAEAARSGFNPRGRGRHVGPRAGRQGTWRGFSRSSNRHWRLSVWEAAETRLFILTTRSLSTSVRSCSDHKIETIRAGHPASSGTDIDPATC